MKKKTCPKPIFKIFKILFIFSFLCTAFFKNYFENIKFPKKPQLTYAASNTFTTSGSWLTPTGIYTIDVECWGGGGAGGGITTNRRIGRGGGGAGGQYASISNTSCIPGTSYNIVVGAGGTGSFISGQAGEDSTFNGNVVIAKGGAGGQSYESGYQPGVGTTSGGAGDVVYAGGSGSAGGTGSTGGAGGGGAGSSGAGGNASGNTAGTGTSTGGGNGGAGLTTSSSGNPGSIYGGAGGAGASTVANKTTNYSGANGAPGQCIVTFTDTFAPSILQTYYSPTWYFATNPYNVSNSRIDMSAETGYDYSTPIEFIFTLDNSSCPSGYAGTGGTSSSWQTSTSYSDTGLDVNKCYGYTIQSRDSSSPINTGTASAISFVFTSANTPGTPTLSNPTLYTLDIDNDSNGNPTTGPDTKYAIQVTYANPADSSWESKWVAANGYRSDFEVWLTDSEVDNITMQDLQKGTEYGVSVKARNEDGDETSLSSEGRGTTDQMQTSANFLTSGTWTVPDGVNAADVECWGGGGGGGGSTANTTYGGGGGGGGAYSKGTNILVAPGEKYQVIIGLGGSGGTPASSGNPGGNTTFDTDVVIALGGEGGGVGGSSAGIAGEGGSADNSTGDTVNNGGNGASGLNLLGGGGGEGSGSNLDGYSATGQTGGSGTDGGNGGNGGNSNSNGTSGSAPGGGGGGAGNGSAVTGFTGGSGAKGRCLITYKERVDGTLSCKTTTSCTSGVVVYRMSDLTNAHAELPSQSNYSQMICCTGVPGLLNSCNGNYKTVLKFSSITNAHVEKNTQENYPEQACLQVPENGVLEIGYKADNCDGYDTILGSISSITNAHVGDKDAYPLKVCATGLVAGTITFSISNNTLGFGILSAYNPKFATSNGQGSENEISGNKITASTNGTGGYTIYVQGDTLKSNSNPEFSISAIGETPALPIAGSEQFGIRVSSSGGNGGAFYPYNDSVLYAYYASSSTADDIAGDLDGDDIPTEFPIYYLSNISGGTEVSDYSTNLTFIVVSNF